MVDNQEKFSRQILAFGHDGQERIAKAKVAVVGVGGIGFCIIQQLSYLGTTQFMLLEDDLVDASNLNRLPGVFSEDIGKAKVEVARRLIKSISPQASVISLGNLCSQQSIEGLSAFPDVIFGCVDNDAARFVLTHVAAAYEKTFIDCATEIHTQEQSILEFGGRIVVARPGKFCLLCANQIDIEIARQELESEQEKRFRRAHGYGLGVAGKAPSVISFNTVIAGLAVTEFIMLLTGVREPAQMLIYRGMKGIVSKNIDEKKAGCIVCDNIVGKPEDVDWKRFWAASLPKDFPN